MPVLVKSKYHQKTEEAELYGSDSAVAHWRALVQNYRRTPHLDAIAAWLEPLYLGES